MTDKTDLDLVIEIGLLCGYRQAQKVRNYPSSWGKGSAPLSSPFLFFVPPSKKITVDDCTKWGWPESYHESQAHTAARSDLPCYLTNLDDAFSLQLLLSDKEMDRYCELLGGSLRACATASARARALAFLEIKKNETD